MNVDELIGMTERSAVRKIENARFIARVISRDGIERVAVSDDQSDDRVNLVCVDGVVTKAWIG